MSTEEKWVIDIDGLEAGGRSFTLMVSPYLCAKCRKKLKVETANITSADILKSLKTCCAKADDFITSTMPLQESVFRVLLAGGNKPMTVGEISRELGIRRNADAYRTAPELIVKLLKNGRHYGFLSRN